jgi:hypothetical protein
VAPLYTETTGVLPKGDNAGTAGSGFDEDRIRPATPLSAWWYLGSDMGKRILGFLVAVCVILLAVWAWQKYHTTDDAGEVHVDSTSSALKDNSDTESDPVRPRPSALQTAQPPVVQNTTVAPATDSISPNPTNGTTYAGSGKFQVYRQGNLTWRVDTESGHACILFATMEEWSKPIVYNNGCNKNS